MKVLTRSFGLWTILAAILWLLLEPDPTRMPGMLAGVACLLGLPLAAGLTFLSAAAVPPRRLWQWPFWTLTVAGWLMVGLLLVGRLTAKTPTDDRQMLVFASLAVFAVFAWLTTRTERKRLWQAVPNIISGTAIVASLAFAWHWAYEAKTTSLTARAEARWAEIGLPMNGFEETLAPVAENSGSEVAREAFHELLSQRFYKPGTGAAMREPVIAPSPEASKLVAAAGNILSRKLPASDQLDADDLPLASLEPHSADFEETYRRILAAEPPTWACNPQDGPKIDVPNFLGLRRFSQLAAVESLRRLAAGDEQGAALPLEACEKLGARLENNPTLVALMIHVAMDSLVASQQARLPGSVEDFEGIARDAARWRESLVRSLQWDAWVMLHHAKDVAHEYSGNPSFTEEGETWSLLKWLPEWTRPYALEMYIQRECAVGALHNAEHAAICRAPRTRALRDFGTRLHDRVSSMDPTICEVNISRVTKRMHAMLLLREQVSLVRSARERLAAGEPIESRSSAVLPRATWEVTADAEQKAVSIRLINGPKWVYEGDVAGPDFWVLPLDGSVPWQFRTAAKATASL